MKKKITKTKLVQIFFTIITNNYWKFTSATKVASEMSHPIRAICIFTILLHI